MTSVATFNLRFSLTRAQARRDLNRLIGHRPDVIALQEVSRDRARGLREQLAREGYGLAIVNDVPIAYKLGKFKLLQEGTHKLNDKVAGMPGSKGRARVANWLALRDRKTGETSVFSNVHLIAGSQYTQARRRLHNRQMAALADLHRDLREKYGDDASYFSMGDFNVSNRARMRALREAGLNTYMAPGDTGPKGGRPDWISSSRKRLSARVLRGFRSDHQAYLAKFGEGSQQDPKDPDTGDNTDENTGGGAGGGGNGGDGGGNGGGNGNGNDGMDDISAFELFSDLLESWGVPVGADIEAIIRQAVLDGITPDNIGLIIPEIQQTNSWNTRFPGWKQRIANGYNQITVEEYLQLEDAYHRIMEQAGLPAGFYDDPADFGNWIANDVSPDEIGGRVQLAVKTAQAVDPTARQLMAQFYGLTTGDIASYFLDQSRALPVIERQYETANVAAWAARAGFDVGSMGRYESLVDAGVTAEQAAQSYGTVKSLSDTVGGVASVYGENYDQSDAESDVFFGQSEKRRRLMAQEAATFSGRSAGMTGSARRQSY